jgi:hypothetical protein
MAGTEHAAIRAEGREILKVLSKKEGKTPASAPASGMHSHGVFRYVLARVQLYVMAGEGAGMSFGELSGKADVSAPTSYKAVYKHPETAAQFHEMLHQWEWALYGTGVANPLVVKQFLQDVVYSPARTKHWSWMMAYAHFLSYIEFIEDKPERKLNLSNVFAAGAHDDRKDRAAVIGVDVFGSLFATGAQAARGPRNDSVTKVPGSLSSQRPCNSWNDNKPCRPEDIVTGPDGKPRCSFRHACGQELAKGADGKPKFCFMDHRKCHGCKNPEFKQ